MTKQKTRSEYLQEAKDYFEKIGIKNPSQQKIESHANQAIKCWIMLSASEK